MKFTDASIRSLKPRAERFEIWETNGEGLGLRISPKGRKTWIYMYRFEGKARRMTLGTYPAMPLTEAHKAHADACDKLKHNIDPGSLRVQANIERRKAETVKELADLYLEKWARPRKRSWREDERILYKDIIPVIGDQKAVDIRRREIIQILDGVAERGSPIQANRTLACVRKMFNYAVSRDIIESSPCQQIRAPGAEKCRDRTLTPDEIKTLWASLDDTCKPRQESVENRLAISPTIALALKLQLVTAQRKGEVISARWDELDLDSGWWTIPAEKAKNKLAHRVPLSPLALEVIESIKQATLKHDEDGNEILSDWLFPSPRGNKPITPSAVNRGILNNRELIGLPPFTPHDLRRTAATQMASSGITRLVISKILNHAETSVTAVYDRHGYDTEKRRALDAWGRKLEDIITGKRRSNIINLTRTA